METEMEYEHILGATDFSELGDIALKRAAELAIANDARLTVVHVLAELEAPSPLFAHYVVESDEDQRTKAKAAAIAALRDRLAPEVRESGIEIRYEVAIGDPAAELLRMDVRLKPDLIVLATHGRRGWQHWIMGSVAERVVQMAQADVLTVRTRSVDEAPPIR